MSDGRTWGRRRRAQTREFACGTPLANTACMDTLDTLLHELHQSIDRLADDLALDRPDLATALRRRSESIPRPANRAEPHVSPGARAACMRLYPLLYHALDAGLIEAREFDALMLLRIRAGRTLERRARVVVSHRGNERRVPGVRATWSSTVSVPYVPGARAAASAARRACYSPRRAASSDASVTA
jgi:hypothetical protein